MWPDHLSMQAVAALFAGFLSYKAGLAVRAALKQFAIPPPPLPPCCPGAWLVVLVLTYQCCTAALICVIISVHPIHHPARCGLAGADLARSNSRVHLRACTCTVPACRRSRGADTGGVEVPAEWQTALEVSTLHEKSAQSIQLAPSESASNTCGKQPQAACMHTCSAGNRCAMRNAARVYLNLRWH